MKTLKTQPQVLTDLLEAHLATRVAAMKEAAAIVDASGLPGADRPTGALQEQAEAALALLRVRAPTLARMLSAGYPVVSGDAGEVRIDPQRRIHGPSTEMLQAGWSAPTIFPSLDAGELEEGSVLLMIEDPRHGATAAVAAAVAFAATQIPAQLRGSPDTVWGRVNLFRHALQGVLRTGEAALTAEDFVGWNRVQPRTRDIAEAPAVIAGIAASSKCQRVIATQILGAWLQDLCDRIESESPAHARGRVLRERLETVHDAFSKTLDGMSRMLAESRGVPTQGAAIHTYCHSTLTPGPLVVALPTARVQAA
jgi:hypothetical protein